MIVGTDQFSWCCKIIIAAAAATDSMMITSSSVLSRTTNVSVIQFLETLKEKATYPTDSK